MTLGLTQLKRENGPLVSNGKRRRIWLPELCDMRTFRFEFPVRLRKERALGSAPDVR
jgi:hypothetical protein